MKLTETQLRSIIRKELQELMTPEFGEQGTCMDVQIDKYEAIRNQLEDQISSYAVDLLGKPPDEHIANMHLLAELMDDNSDLFKLFIQLFVK